MALGASDYFLQQLTKGSAKNYASPARSSKYVDSPSLVDPNVDRLWKSSAPVAPQAEFDNYFEYFFSGQDIIVHIDGTEDEPQYQLPIVQLGFNIQQQKMPIYGFWDYTYSCVARGTRIIQGSFTIATRYPGFLRDVLSHIASSRLNAQAAAEFNYPQPQTQDEFLVQQYWGDTLDPSVLQGSPNVFSVHPPFDFVILYGVQNLSLNQTQNDWGNQAWIDSYNDNNAYVTDVNERLVADSDLVNNANRLLLLNTEITGCQIGFDSSGAVCTEAYSFMSQDIQIPQVNNPQLNVKSTGTGPSTNP